MIRTAHTIAIDGPAGSGKGTIARAVARSLHARYVDSGAMYRTVALLSLEHGIDPGNEDGLVQLAREAGIGMEDRPDGLHVIAAGRDVTESIRGDEVDAQASRIATVPGLRRELVRQQKAMADEQGVVMEGRDIGTVVFPDADLKIYLTATPEVRAARRVQQLRQMGKPADYEAILARMIERDQRDSARADSPLRPAPDAIVIDTTGLTINEVVESIVRWVIGTGF